MNPNESSSLTLRVAVVGHTNTGKTSLLRTLTRDQKFGEVRPSPGTTRHVEGVRIGLEPYGQIILFDTPGIEDSMALLDYIERLVGADQRVDGPERIRRFLNSPEAKGRFEQEARVLTQLMHSEAGLYVIDVRDPVLTKYKDELRILSWCGKPILPVMNFLLHQPSRITEWQAALGDLGLHMQTQFDTVAPALEGEIQLYKKLALLLGMQYRQLLEHFYDLLRKQRQQRLTDAKLLLAELLIDVAAWQASCSADPHELKAYVEQMQNLVRSREQRCVQALLSRYQFSSEDYLPLDFNFGDYRWGTDLFHPEALKQLGIQMSKGLATGALAGATFDLLTAGLSLGTGTLVGATVGGVWQGVNQWGQKIMQRWRGQADLSVGDDVLRALALRQLGLVYALEHRGHAAQHPIQLQGVLGADAPSSTDQAESASNKPVADQSGRPAAEPSSGSAELANEQVGALEPAGSEASAAALGAQARQATAGAQEHRQSRGQPLEYDWRSDPLPPVLVQARHHPQWSTLLYPNAEGSDRKAAIDALAKQLSLHF